MTHVRMVGLTVSVALTALAVPVLGQDAGQIPADRIRKGADIYARYCSYCHGPRLLEHHAPLDLRKFPPDEKSRFVTSVAKGKNQMPPLGGLLTPEEIEALWAYVMAGEK